MGKSLLQSYSVRHLLNAKELPLEQLYGGIYFGFSGDIRGARGWSPPNNFGLPKCDTLFISSSSQEAIKNKVQAGIVASNCFFKLCLTGIRQHKGRAIIPVA